MINGDFVDFLAEDEDGACLWTADQASAVRKFIRITERAKPCFEGLRSVLARNRFLTILLGNHDVELALPRVRRELVNTLGGERNLRFVFDGQAYSIGGLLIEHGNRYDPWNRIDHSALRQEVSVRSRGLEIDEERRKNLFFIPPAGTHLVIHFMNQIKRRYRFIDLLKPETNAVVPFLLALEPDYVPRLREIARASALVSQVIVGKKKGPAPGELSGTEDELHAILERTLGDRFAEFWPLFAPALVPRMDISPLPLSGTGKVEWESDDAAAGASQGIRSLFHLFTDRFTSWVFGRGGDLVATPRSAHFEDEASLRRLHSALLVLHRQGPGPAEPFDVSNESGDYITPADDMLARGFEVVAFGHTHLPKRIRREHGWYLNSGTWADVMRLPEDVLAPEFKEARPSLEAFARGLKRNELDPFIRRYLTYLHVSVEMASGKTHIPKLLRWRTEGPGEEINEGILPNR